MKIVFFGTSNVALPVLEALNHKHEILAVVTKPDVKVGRKQLLEESPVSVLANEMKLKTLKPEKIKGNTDIFEMLKNLNADIFVVVSFGKILPLDIINLPPLKTINVHFSLLPKYRGPSPIQYALLNGEKETGTTIFILDEEVDHGDILAQEKCEIDNDDNFFSLSQKMAFKSASLLLPTLEKYHKAEITPQPQEHALASFTKIIEKNDGKIDWNKTATEIYNQFRAFYPWPGVWTIWQGKKLKVLECAETNAQNSVNLPPGTVLEGGKVVCGQNTVLQLKKLKIEGKNETDITSFSNGYQNFFGAKLE